MTFLFNRLVELQIGRAGEEGRIFKDLRIEFDIDKNRKSTANAGKISIYNLNEQSRNLIADEGQKYQIKAGYAGFGFSPILGILSSGDILDAETNRKGPDLVTALKIGEATRALADKTLDKSYKEGVPVKSIVDDLISGLDLARGAVTDLKDVVFNSGYSLSGKIKDRMDELMDKQGLEWSVQNGEVQITDKDGFTKDGAVFLSEDTGLLKAYKAKSVKSGAASLKDVIRFEALLNPDIKIGRLVNIISTISGISEFVTVRKLKYKGDNKDGPFVCTGEAS